MRDRSPGLAGVRPFQIAARCTPRLRPLARSCPSMITLLDETRAPSVREIMGRLLSGAETAAIAIAHVRLAAIDLQPSELGQMQHCRLLLARFDSSFAADAQSLTLDPTRFVQLQRLLAFAESGRLAVHAARSQLWLPDFSVY